MPFKMDPKKLKELLERGDIKLEIDSRSRDTDLLAEDVLDALKDVTRRAADYDRDFDRGKQAYDRVFDRTTGGP